MPKLLELEDLAPGVNLGHYLITKMIAQGGMGTVFRALEPALERHVAIKVLRREYAANPNYVQYFQEEARAVAALRHPNIVPIYYIGQEGNVVFFSMAYIDGETFDDRIERKEFFTEEQAKWFLGQAIAALHCAHKANMVHLDIKPANFLIDHSNTIMLTDFGLAQKIVKEGDGEAEREAFGTPAYVAPEQITREATDQRTDIYSLGATLFHLMTGSPPFEGPTVEDIVWGHLEKPFPVEKAQAAGLHTGWIYLLKKMMERKPEARFDNYRDLRDAMLDVYRFRYQSAEVVPETESEAKPLVTPRRDANTQSLHGLLAQGKGKWESASTKSGAALHYNGRKIEEALKNRIEPLRVAGLANTIRDLTRKRQDDPEVLVEALEKLPSFDNAIRRLVDFMIAPGEERGPDTPTEPMELLETVGLERAQNLALTFLALRYDFSASGPFDWTPLWRHSMTVGIMIDFIYDALGLRRTGYEYVSGMFHDIGKVVLADLFPFAYFSVMNKSILNEMPLAECEYEMFETHHADMGASWLKEIEVPSTFIDAVWMHETPDEISRRSTLSHAVVSINHLVQQLGIGYSGNAVINPCGWEEIPSTLLLWEARADKSYPYESFTSDILESFRLFPDLI